MAITLSVAGVEVNAVLSTIRIHKTSNGVSTLDCEIDFPDGFSGSAYGSSSYGSATYGSTAPSLDGDVIMTNDAVREFGGIVVDVHEGGLCGLPMGGARTVHLTAHGYAARAAKAVVHGLYPSGTLKAKVTQLLADTTNPLPDISLHGSQADGPVLPAQEYDYVNTKDVLDELSLRSGWPWKIDDEADLRFIEPGSLSAPFTVTDGDEQTVGDVVVAWSRSDYYNRVIVRAGTITSVRSDAGEIDDHGLSVLPVQSPPETPQEGADIIADMSLARSLVVLKRVTYDTYENGVEPGQSQTITLADRNVNNIFLIGDVSTFFEADRLRRRVVAAEGLVYKTGWREEFKSLLGGNRTITAGFVGGGTSAQRFAYFLGGFGNAEESPIPTWIPAAPRHAPVTVQLNTIPRQTNSALVFVSLHALSEGVSVKARLFDVTLNAPCPGESAIVTSTTAPSIPISFTATIIDGSHWHRLELLPSHVNEGVVGVGYTE